MIKERVFVPTLKKMIDKNLLKWQDVVFLRGMVISKTIELEIKINELLAQYFEVADAKRGHFDLMLEGTTISLEGKKITLNKITKNEKLKKFERLHREIQLIQSDRNILAHSIFDPISKSFASRGKDHVYDRSEMAKILNRIETTSRNLDDAIRILEPVQAHTAE